MRGFNNDVIDDEVEEVFKEFAGLDGIRIIRDPYTKEPRKFGFAYFDTPEHCDKALDALGQSFKIGKRVIYLEKAKRTTPR